MTNDDFSTQVAHILQLSGYDGDSQSYADDIVAGCLEKTIYQAISELPEVERNQVTTAAGHIADRQNLDQLMNWLVARLGAEHMHLIYSQSINSQIDDMVAEVAPALSASQQQQIAQYLSQVRQ